MVAIKYFLLRQDTMRAYRFPIKNIDSHAAGGHIYLFSLYESQRTKKEVKIKQIEMVIHRREGGNHAFNAQFRRSKTPIRLNGINRSR